MKVRTGWSTSLLNSFLDSLTRVVLKFHKYLICSLSVEVLFFLPLILLRTVFPSYVLSIWNWAPAVGASTHRTGAWTPGLSPALGLCLGLCIWWGKAGQEADPLVKLILLHIWRHLDHYHICSVHDYVVFVLNYLFCCCSLLGAFAWPKSSQYKQLNWAVLPIIRWLLPVPFSCLILFLGFLQTFVDGVSGLFEILLGASVGSGWRLPKFALSQICNSAVPVY